jgi:phage baseplate assembly protein gpV
MFEYRIGKVHKVDAEKNTARVKFDQFDGMISAELKIVWQREKWTPAINDDVMCICIPNGDGDGFIVGRI